MTSIVIAAHNEAAVIGRCLDALLADGGTDEFDVTVVANGCSDDTARVARGRAGVRVLDLVSPGKVSALNAGDEVALGFPRIYLDADILVSADAIRALCRELKTSSAGQPTAARVLATTARRQIDVSRSPLLVRAYYAINSRLPVFRDALFGRGVMALSAEGRSRFGTFPDVVADDLFVDSLFATSEKREVDSVSAVVAAPRTTRDLVRRLVRVRRGNASIRSIRHEDGARHGAGVLRGAGRRKARMSWFAEVVVPNPSLAPAAVCYAAITVAAAILARRRQPAGASWGRDESSRRDDYQSSNG
jgi:glycosyltransferase involved in cell wall biosynthesis